MISSGSISTRIFQTGFFSIRPLRSHRAFTRPPILNPTNIRLELVILMELIDCEKINYCSIFIFQHLNLQTLMTFLHNQMTFFYYCYLPKMIPIFLQVILQDDFLFKDCHFPFPQKIIRIKHFKLEQQRYFPYY